MTAVRSPASPVVLHPSAELATFASQLQYSDIPEAVSLRCEDLFLDTMASILAGSSARAVKAMARRQPMSSSKTMCTTGPCFIPPQ